MSYRQHLVRAADSGPAVEVFPDGRVALHTPAFLQGAGHYRLSLEPEELAGFVLLITRLLDFDEEAARHHKVTRRRERLSAGETVPLRVGAAISSFQLAAEGRIREIRWRGARFDAEHTDSVDLGRLAALESRLADLLTDPRRSVAEAP